MYNITWHDFIRIWHDFTSPHKNNLFMAIGICVASINARKRDAEGAKDAEVR